jgi:nucleoside-diphosphate-sugar epimerase
MKIVVTGGTGFIGREIVRRLLHDGQHEVVVTTRNPARDLWGGRVRLEQAFAGDRLSLGKAFTGAEVVVHAIQFPNHPVEKPSLGRTYMEVDGRGTVAAAETARKLGVRRFVYMSGAGAGQGRPQPWFAAKDLAEESIRATGMEHGFLRPSWIYGPNDRSMNKFVTFIRRLPMVPVVGDGKTPVYPIHVQDVARCAAELALREDAKAAAFELGGERMTMDEVIRTVMSVLGKWRPLLHHPKGLMKLLTRPLTLLPEPPLSPDAVDFVTEVVEIDPRPAREYFGFEFKRLEEGLREYLP